MTTQIASLITSKAGVLSVLTGIVWILTVIAPVLPAVWGNLITAILGVFAFYHIGNAVAGAREAGSKAI
jgi:hypothetical protein